MCIAEEDILQLQLPQQIWTSDEDYNIDRSIAEASFICHMEHSQSLSIDPMMHPWLYKSNYMWLSSPMYRQVQIFSKVFSQQLVYTSLEQQGTKSEEEGLNTSQREEMKR